MTKLDLANRQGDFFLCLSLCEDVGLSLFADFIEKWQDIKKNEIYCLQSKLEFDEKREIKIEIPYKFVNFIFASLNKEGYKKFINISDHIEMGSVISRIRKVIVFDSFPFQQSDTNDFITALKENLIDNVIPLSVGVVYGTRKFSSTDIVDPNKAIEEDIVNYKSLLGDKETFKIKAKLSSDNLKQIISRQTSSRLLRHQKHLKTVNSLGYNNKLMKEMFELDFEVIIDEIILEFKTNKYTVEEISKKIYELILENIKNYGFESIQRENSFEELKKLINEESILLARNFHNYFQNIKPKPLNKFKISASKNIADKIYNHNKNEINYWNNEK